MADRRRPSGAPGGRRGDTPAGRPPGLISLLAVAALAAALALAPVGPEAAHAGSHPFESVIEGIDPAPLGDGITVRMLDHDERIELTNRSGRTVVVEGYDGEPYARIESDGPVRLNLRSPALAVNNDRWGRTPPTGREDPAARPEWARVGEDGRLAWFDRRAQYRRPGVPARVADPDVEQELWRYRVPIRVGGEPAAIRGTLSWTGGNDFPTGAFVALLIATGGCAILGAWTIGRLRAAGEEDGGEPVGEDGPVGAGTPGRES